MNDYRLLPQCVVMILFLHFFCFCSAAQEHGKNPTVPDDTLTFTLPLYTITFSPSGNVRSITPHYHQEHRSRISKLFTNTTDKPLLQLFTEYNLSPFTITTTASPEDSLLSIIFTADTHRITWRLPANRYHFDVIATGAFTSDSVVTVNGTNPDCTQQYSALAVSRHSVKSLAHTATLDFKPGTVSWFGIRDHFWTVLLHPATEIIALTSNNAEVQAEVRHPLPGNPVSFSVYAGPITLKTLGSASHDCTHLLYPVWFWMRWLSMALLHLFNLLLGITGNVVISIILLSVCVKIIIAPLYRIAARWQKEVNRQKTLLEPRLNAINREYKGEEQTKRTLALYKELGISPLYTLKSLLSAAIQIPVFFAAYHMLSEHIALSGVHFLWISDLASPDHLFALPFSLPLFGNYFNLLPFVMTSISLASSFIHSDGALSETLHKKQRRSLLFMAGAFFLLLYTSPAGMLLYWTMNNLLSLLDSLRTACKRRTLHSDIENQRTR